MSGIQRERERRILNSRGHVWSEISKHTHPHYQLDDSKLNSRKFAGADSKNHHKRVFICSNGNDEFHECLSGVVSLGRRSPANKEFRFRWWKWCWSLVLIIMCNKCLLGWFTYTQFNMNFASTWDCYYVAITFSIVRLREEKSCFFFSVVASQKTRCWNWMWISINRKITLRNIRWSRKISLSFVL